MANAAVETRPYARLLESLNLTTLPDAHRAELLRVGGVLYDQYRRNDAAAVSGQRQHQVVVLAFGTFGTLAVLLALGRLAGLRVAQSIEMAALAIASVAVVLGLVASRQRAWLLARHRAERCQLLFWGLVTEPALWGGTPHGAEAALSRANDEAAAIAGLSYVALEEWLDRDDGEVPTHQAEASAPPALVTAYCTERLDGQARYFEARSLATSRLDGWTRHLPLAAFVLSVVAAIGHFATDFVSREKAGHMGDWLLFAAAAIPACAGAFRIVRGAFEPARNFARYRGRQIVLRSLAVRIRARARQTGAVYFDLAHGEQLLAAEHREWLRLMMEAEWIG